RGGVISYETRRHFFLDWLELGFKDAGKEVSEEAFLVEKTLNKGEVLKGVPERRVRYFVVPKDALLRGDYKNLKEGDLVGVYSEKEWLDVSHIGVVVKKEGKVFIRHASSLYCRVVDEPIEEFLRRSGELVILRRK
ncbi:MAG: DUF1460 domain-containing protein, partial [Aquificae bacterium]|nr:DUF1460 domain-containing protein [Aquificota bacterium]